MANSKVEPWSWPGIMRLLVVVSIAGVAAKRSDVPVPDKEEPQACPLVPTLLHAAGFSMSCVAASLAECHNTENNQSSLSQDLHEAVVQLRQALNEFTVKEDHRPRHCRDLLAKGDSGVGLREVFPYHNTPDIAASVVCDQETDGGGWTVFQRRINLTEREDFYRTWTEYRLGFGSLDGGEFWLGLDLLHTLTSHYLQELRVDLEDYYGNQTWARYGMFHVDDRHTNYRLNVGRYTGTAGDGLSAGRHAGHAFSTHDADHDSYSDNCAALYKGGWWYDQCHITNLNGYQYEGEHASYADGIQWRPWTGYHYSLRATTMMIRPAFYV